MQTQTPPAAEIKTSVDILSAAITIGILVLPRIWPLLSKLKLKTTDTGETRKALAGVIGDMQVKIEALEKVNADLTDQNTNLKADNEAMVIRINNLETDLKVLQKVVEVLSKPPAAVPPPGAIGQESDKEAG